MPAIAVAVIATIPATTTTATAAVLVPVRALRGARTGEHDREAPAARHPHERAPAGRARVHSRGQVHGRLGTPAGRRAIPGQAALALVTTTARGLVSSAAAAAAAAGQNMVAVSSCSFSPFSPFSPSSSSFSVFVAFAVVVVREIRVVQVQLGVP